MPPLRIKASGQEYMPNDLVPKTATGGSRPRRNIDISKTTNNQIENRVPSSRRIAHTSHVRTRSGWFNGQQLDLTQNKTSKENLQDNLESKKKYRETHVAYNPKIRPKMDGEENYQQFWALFNQKEEQETIYLVSSVNHWMPIKLADADYLAKLVAARISGAPDPVEQKKERSERSTNSFKNGSSLSQ